MSVSQGALSNLESQQKQQRPSVSADSDFTRWRRCLFVIIVTYVGCLSPLAANIHPPLYQSMSEEFDVSLKTLSDMTYMFMFVSAVSALAWAQLSDSYGRRCVYLISLSLLFVANLLLTALPANFKTLYGLKALQAIGSSSVYSVGIATIADVIPIGPRGRCLSFFMIGPFLGFGLGPIISIDYFENQWRLAFGLLAVMTGISILLIYFLLPETARGVVGTGEYFNQGQFKYTVFQERVIADDYLPNQKFHWDHYFRLSKLLFVFVPESVIISCFYAMYTTMGEKFSTKPDYSPRFIMISNLCPLVALIGLSIISGLFTDFEDDRFDIAFLLIIPGIFIIELGGLLFARCIGEEDALDVVLAGIIVFSAEASLDLIAVTHFLTGYVEDFPASAVAYNMLTRTLACNITYFIVLEIFKRIGGWCFVIFMVVCMVCSILAGCVMMFFQEDYGGKDKFEYKW